ncbi:signal recognition particle-docking protein FtsY [Oceanospirillum beijerinckii]|uniref:signal recognition particle-docking protein FtsY n=1 Tax=Oceanospirillum beijerinckii TaxID=64976 RepID=UPI0004056457|nr:signal recognition particle-docking protein FtsY [Oceanospirillum beijerinckii]
MFGLFKRKKKKAEQPEAQVTETQAIEQAEETAVERSEQSPAPVSQDTDTQITPMAETVDNTTVETQAAELTAPEVRDPVVETQVTPEPTVIDEPKAESTQATQPEPTPAPVPVAAPQPEVQEKPKKKGFFSRIKAGLGRTRANLTEGLASLFLGKKQIDDDLLEEIETQLLVADIGVEATSDIIERLTERVQRKQLADAQALYEALKEELRAMLEPANKPLEIPNQASPYVILMVGVNGVGKTTTIGKLAKKFQSEGKSVMLAAGDTFRAAAVEQLQVWGERNQVPVIAQHTGADSASVIFDAIQAAKARNADILIADTAGRLQNKSNLMEELKKVTRVMKKLDVEAPHEVMLVVDAGTGQNALSQASLFNEAVGLTGITLTKLDGTAKGGIVFALAKQMEIPIRFIGVGEQVDDLRPFDADQFTNALFDQSES